MFTSGTDTEFFLKDKNGKYVSAIRYIKGGKNEPVALPSGGNVTYDNVAMEFATPIADTEDDLVKKVDSTMREAIAHLPNGVVLDSMSSTEFPEEELQHEDARLFGCDPDFDAWGPSMNEQPDWAVELPFRCVGGHPHVGYVKGSGNDFLLDPMGKIAVVKAMDATIGLPITMLDYSQATIARRELYGKAGCHRPTEYGLEYRTLSNFWLFSPSLVRLVHKLAGETLEIFKDGSTQELIDMVGETEIQRVVNKGDKTAAESLWVKHISPYFSKEIVTLFKDCKKKKKFDIYNEWSL